MPVMTTMSTEKRGQDVIFEILAATCRRARLYDAYLEHLAAAGITAVPAAITSVVPDRGNVVVYIIQERLGSGALAHRAIHALPAGEVVRLFGAILEGIGRVFAYNDANEGRAAIGFDAQMSNWAKD